MVKNKCVNTSSLFTEKTNKNMYLVSASTSITFKDYYKYVVIHI